MPPAACEDSVNILPALLGRKPARPLREATVHHSGLGEFGIRQGRWKLLLHPGSGGTNYRANPAFSGYYGQPIQLYDIQADSGELRNLASNHPDLVARLKVLLARYVVEGRSTPGVPQANDTANDWKRLHWMGTMTPAARAGGKP
jgi:arylsulfatase A-like enzyme